MSPTTETCACGASITLGINDSTDIGWRLGEWRKGHRHDLDAAYACRERDEAMADRDRIGAMVEWLAEVIVDARQACIDAESIEPSGSPEWVESGIAMRKTVLYEVRKVLNRERTAHPSALDRVEAERDEARAEVERLWIEVRNASDTLIRQGQIMHGLAKQVARVRALCDEAGAQVFMGSAADRWLDYEAVEDALDGEA